MNNIANIAANPYFPYSNDQMDMYRNNPNPYDRMYQCIKATMRAITREENDINIIDAHVKIMHQIMCHTCLLYTSPSPRDRTRSRMPSSA